MFYTKFKTNKFRLADYDDYRWCNLLGVWCEVGYWISDAKEVCHCCISNKHI